MSKEFQDIELEVNCDLLTLEFKILGKLMQKIMSKIEDTRYHSKTITILME